MSVCEQSEQEGVTDVCEKLGVTYLANNDLDMQDVIAHDFREDVKCPEEVWRFPKLNIYQSPQETEHFYNPLSTSVDLKVWHSLES